MKTGLSAECCNRGFIGHNKEPDSGSMELRDIYKILSAKLWF